MSSNICPLINPFVFHTSNSCNKFPLIVYHHGGAFVFMSPASKEVHDFCLIMTAQLDAIEALHFIKSSQENWLTQFIDLSNCFLMGTSAGGNIAYHAGLIAFEDEQMQKLKPLNIKGLILHHPYFSGLERTESKLKMVNESMVPLAGNDLMWKLSLPEGADRDHKYSNPIDEYRLKMSEIIRTLGIRVLITGVYGDPVIDRQVGLTKFLENKGVGIFGHFGEGYHNMEVSDLSKADSLFRVVKDFMFN